MAHDEYQHLRESADSEFTVTRDGVIELADNDDFIAEASDLGLAPGVWPERIVIDEWRFNRGRTTYIGLTDSVRSVVYVKEWSGPVRTLEVFND